MESNQKYHKGDRVRIHTVGHPMWEGNKVYDMAPDKVGKVVTIEGSYNDLYGGEPDKNPHYQVRYENGNTEAWLYEYQLEPEDTPVEERHIETVPSAEESEFHKELNKHYKEYMQRLMWGPLLPEKSEEEKYKDKLKLAWVFIDGTRDTRVMVKCHQETKEAYKLGEWYSLLEPMEKIEYKIFERWCTSFDV